ncbi:MAG: hypothetical protein HOI65_11430 [Opitutae bacterium]|nr:hypothetical protein [Opitutae bacterium]
MRLFKTTKKGILSPTPGGQFSSASGLSRIAKPTDFAPVCLPDGSTGANGFMSQTRVIFGHPQ